MNAKKSDKVFLSHSISEEFRDDEKATWFLAPRANPPACQVALCRSTTSCCFVSVLIFKFWSPNFLCDSFRFWTSFLVNKF